MNSINNKPVLRTPNPNIGGCNKKGKWADPKQINDCKECVRKSAPDYPYFYCDGTCTSEYELGGGGCALNELVAKTESQCENPCYQVGLPSDKGIGSGCTDDFDCGDNEKCEGGACIVKDKQLIKGSEKNIIEIINSCSSTDNWKICLSDISKLNCKDIKDLIKLNIETSKKEGAYNSDRLKIINAFKEIKDNPDILDNTYNIINNTITNINCAINEIDNQYNLKSEEKINLLNTVDTKANYVSHILKNDKDVRASLSNILNDVKEEGKGKKEYSLKYVILIIIIIIVIIFLSYLVMRKRQSSPSILNYSIPNYLI
jgi:hypothetical protein